MSLDQLCKLFVDFWNNNFVGVLHLWRGGESTNLEPDPLEWNSVWHWVAFAVLLIAAFTLLFTKSKLIEKLSKYIMPLSMIVWGAGVLVYIVGFFDKEVTGVSVVLRAIISSFKMFVVSNDLARVNELLRNDSSYMSAFAILHFIAAFITFLFIFKLIGYKIKSSLRLIFHNIFRAKDNVVHLFWGVNEASILLAEDMSRKSKYRKDTIIFVDIDEESDDNSQRKVTLSHITNTITIKNSEIARLDEIHAFVDHCYNGPAAIKGDNNTDIFGELNLNTIGAIVNKSRVVKSYFLSDDEAQNILGALNLQKDKRLRFKNNDNKPDIYIHARKDVNNEVFDHYSQYDIESHRLKMQIVDSAYLSVATLKQNYSTLPVSCVKKNDSKPTGLIDSPFTALIVGFGETGQEAFKFLYEYSSFIGSDFKKSPFMCYAIDAHMNKIAGLIREKMPEIGENELALIQADVNSQEFWNRVKALINDLNYVVIALNNDQLGLSHAVNLFKYALRNRTANQPMLKILVRCYDSANETRMTEVASNLNKSIEKNKIEICLFGQEKKLYSCETILSDETLQEAKEFNRVYENSELSAEEQWKENFGEKEIKRLMTDEKMSRYHAIYDINRRIYQNISNSLHSRTKMILMGFDENDQSDRLKLFDCYVRSRGEDTTKYRCNKETEQLLLNVAMVEHERWIASHKLMGYKYADVKDPVKKLHKNMKRFNELDEKTQSFDCKVIDTTIKIAYSKKSIS